MLRKALATIVTIFLLAGCEGPSLGMLRDIKPTGDAYQVALATNYRELAEAHAGTYDWAVSNYFADKGLIAARNEAVTPAEPEQWDIPVDALPDFVSARKALLAAIAENRSTQPELSASAMAAYDQWVIAQHSRWSERKINEQHTVFSAILAKLQEAHTDSSVSLPPLLPATPEQPSAPSAQPVAAPAKPAVPESTTVTLYFPFDSDRLGDSAQGAMAQLVRYIHSAGNISIAINGHADRVGSEDYNMHLSERRARFVMKELEKSGVAAAMMKYFAFGESDPAVPTEDGVPEPKNRRVEIFIE